MAKLVDQIEAALSSKDDSDAVRLWLWLRISGGGECYVSEILEAPCPNVVRAVNHLHAGARVKFVGPKVRAMPYVRARGKRSPLDGLEGRDKYIVALENPRVAGASAVMREAETWVFDAYNEVRVKNGMRALPESQRARCSPHLRSAAEFLIREKVNPTKFVEFAFEKTLWQPQKFPALSLVGGPWIQGEWLDHEPVAAREHAGHTYETPIGLQDALVDEGFNAAELNDAQVRNVLRMANTHRRNPDVRSPHPDAEVEAMVRWTAANWEEGAAHGDR